MSQPRPKSAEVSVHNRVMQCVGEGKDTPVRTSALQHSEMSQVRRRDMVKRHVLADYLPLADEEKDVDVLVDFGEVVDVPYLGDGESGFVEEWDGQAGGQWDKNCLVWCRVF